MIKVPCPTCKSKGYILKKNISVRQLANYLRLSIFTIKRSKFPYKIKNRRGDRIFDIDRVLKFLKAK